MDGKTTATPDQTDTAGLLFTATEHESHRQELERLLEIRDRDLPQLLRQARGFVASDAAEEIAQLQEDIAVVDVRIGWLEELLRHARIVDDTLASGVVSVGCVVDLEYLDSGRVVTYHVAGSALSADTGALSAGSPVGRALIGRRAGDVVEVQLPTGRSERLRVLAVRLGEVTPWQ
jgi:transcription elongation factor GreA